MDWLQWIYPKVFDVTLTRIMCFHGDFKGSWVSSRSPLFSAFFLSRRNKFDTMGCSSDCNYKCMDTTRNIHPEGEHMNHHNIWAYEL